MPTGLGQGRGQTNGMICMDLDRMKFHSVIMKILRITPNNEANVLQNRTIKLDEQKGRRHDVPTPSEGH